MGAFSPPSAKESTSYTYDPGGGDLGQPHIDGPLRYYPSSIGRVNLGSRPRASEPFLCGRRVILWLVEAECPYIKAAFGYGDVLGVLPRDVQVAVYIILAQSGGDRKPGIIG